MVKDGCACILSTCFNWQCHNVMTGLVVKRRTVTFFFLLKKVAVLAFSSPWVSHHAYNQTHFHTSNKLSTKKNLLKV